MRGGFRPQRGESLKVKIGKGSFVDPSAIVGHPGKRHRKALTSGTTKGLSDILIGKDCLVRAGSIIYEGVTLGDKTQTGNGVVIRENSAVGAECLVGTGTVIEDDCHIASRVVLQSSVYIPTGTRIEEGVFIGPRACLTNDKEMGRGNWKLEPVVIRKNARIGANSTILPGVTIGADAVVGAGAVVTKDVAPRTVVAGNPARVLRKVRPTERARRK